MWNKHSKRINAITLKFNVTKDVSKPFSTKSMFFVELAVYSKNRIAVPIIKNGNWQRYQSLLKEGWTCKTYGLTSDLQIIAYLSKPDTIYERHKNILGVDVNSKCFAISLVTPEGSILHQSYIGKDIWIKRKKIFERRSILQSHKNRGSGFARKLLGKTKRKEHNFVKNRIGEVVKYITHIAIIYDADIAIENLKKFNPKGKRFNKEIMRIPFYTFKENLIARCFDKHITLDIVDSWHTSKWCSHCGAVGRGHSHSNYSLFECKKCGLVVNSDRKASVAVAVKSLLERSSSPNQEKFLISNRRVSINGLVHSDDVVNEVAVQHISQPIMEYHAL
jgi:IS605 OrfB family transposase